MNFAGLDVSRETYDRLNAYAALVEKWNPRINLVAKSTLDQVMTRHIADSAQIYGHAPADFGHWVDLGSGGGFPGIVVGILAAEKNPEGRITLVESDARKCAFLRECSRQLSLGLTIENERIEKLPSQQAAVLSARALASLSDLCRFAALHLAKDGIAIFPKGAGHAMEIDEARKLWSFDLEIVSSQTDPKAALLKLRNIEHV